MSIQALLMNREGEMLSVNYSAVYLYFNNGFALLPFRLQPKPFDRTEFELYLENDQQYLLWVWPYWCNAIQTPKNAEMAGNIKWRSKGRIKRITKLSSLDSIWLRPFFLGCSIKELILGLVLPCLIAYFTAYVTTLSTTHQALPLNIGQQTLKLSP